MRFRLIVIFTVPGVFLFVALGAGFAASISQSNQQELFLDRLSDARYLAVTARQSLSADDPSIVSGELERYREVYGIEAAVLNQAGETWASNGLDVSSVDERFQALAGRRSELVSKLLPWQVDTIAVAEPVLEGGDVIGAVVTSSDTGELVHQTWLSWGMLTAAGLVALAVAAAIANSAASWVLRPVRAVDVAMAEIGKGRLGARIPESTGPPELREVVDHFNQMAAKVEHLMHKQQEFVSNASHELRNPLNALLLRAEDLAMATSGENAAEAEHVRSEGRRMAKILDALLMLARDEDAGATTEPVDVRSLAARRVDGWQPVAGEKDLELRLIYSSAAMVLADEIVLESALDAVIDNAVKFSPSGGTIDVAVIAADGLVELSVRDVGPGLPPREIEKVTDRFWRSKSHRSVRGSGLGLSIASELLDRCGGSLRITPADGGGLRVTLIVPEYKETT